MKTDLDRPVLREDGLTQTAFDIRDIHFQSDSLIVHTIQGNIVLLPIADYENFISAIEAGVKTSLLATPMVP